MQTLFLPAARHKKGVRPTLFRPCSCNAGVVVPQAKSVPPPSNDAAASWTSWDWPAISDARGLIVRRVVVPTRCLCASWFCRCVHHGRLDRSTEWTVNETIDENQADDSSISDPEASAVAFGERTFRTPPYSGGRPSASNTYRPQLISTILAACCVRQPSASRSDRSLTTSRGFAGGEGERRKANNALHSVLTGGSSLNEGI